MAASSGVVKITDEAHFQVVIFFNLIIGIHWLKHYPIKQRGGAVCDDDGGGSGSDLKSR